MPETISQMKTYLPAALFIAAVLCAAYWPALHVNYLFHDDFYYFTGTHYTAWHTLGRCTDYSQTESHLHVLARPVGAVFRCMAGEFLHTIPDGKYVRAMHLGVLALYLLLAFYWLVTCGVARTSALVLACLTGLLTPYQPPIVQVTNGYHLFAAAGSLSALMVSARAIKTKQRAWLLLAFGLLTLALFDYPPGAMLYWAWLAPYVLLRVHGTGKALLQTLGWFALPMFAALPTPKLWGALFGHDARGGFPTSFHKKLAFFRDAIDLGFNFWNVYPLCIVTLAMLAIIAAACGVILYRTPMDRRALVQKGFICAALVPLAFLPNLLVRESTINHRIMLGLKTLLFLYTALAALELVKCYGGRQAKYVTMALAALCLGGAVWATNDNITRYYIAPSHAEYHYLREQLRALNARHPLKDSHVHIVLWHMPPGLEFTDEYGMLSTYWPPDAQGYAVALNEELKLGANPDDILNGNILTTGTDKAIIAPESMAGKPIPNGSAIINMNNAPRP